MLDSKPDVEQQLRQALSEILTARARLIKIIEERKAAGRPDSSTLEAACAKLERLATEMQCVVEAGTHLEQGNRARAEEVLAQAQLLWEAGTARGTEILDEAPLRTLAESLQSAVTETSS